MAPNRPCGPVALTDNRNNDGQASGAVPDSLPREDWGGEAGAHVMNLPAAVAASKIMNGCPWHPPEDTRSGLTTLWPRPEPRKL